MSHREPPAEESPAAAAQVPPPAHPMTADSWRNLIEHIGKEPSSSPLPKNKNKTQKKQPQPGPKPSEERSGPGEGEASPGLAAATLWYRALGLLHSQEGFLAARSAQVSEAAAGPAARSWF